MRATARVKLTLVTLAATALAAAAPVTALAGQGNPGGI
jgi:hypothetical protein